jgi:spermidine synthase
MGKTGRKVAAKNQAESRIDHVDLICLAAFFASGFVGLTYEICWIRKASLVFGSTTWAVSTVLAAFFGGLALGSYYCGRWAGGIRRPLRAFAMVEGGLALVGGLTPFAFDLLDSVYGQFYPKMVNHFAWLSLIRAVLIATIIIPPTVLMGATLPLFCRYFVRRQSRIALPIGLLYSLNTLGAAAGCAVCGFLMIPKIGVHRSIWIAAALNVLVAAAAWRVAGHRTVEPADPVKTVDPKVSRRAWAVMLLFLGSGFVALGNEILWTRFLSLLIRSSVYTYTLTLTMILLGIVLGSLLSAGLFDRFRNRSFAFGLIQVLTGMSVLVVLRLPVDSWRSMVDPIDPFRSMAGFAMVLLIPAVLSGMAFPLAIRMVVESPEWAPAGVGKMTAANTVGGILGSMLIGFVVIPRLGLATGIQLITGLSLAIGVAAWFGLGSGERNIAKGVLAFACAALWFFTPQLSDTRLPADFLAPRDRLIDFEEGIGAHISVVRDNEIKALEIDRLWQGWDRKCHQIMSAHVPMLYQPHPKRVAVVGIGAGQTSSRFLMYDIMQLDCIDIESGLFDLLHDHFDASWMDDPRTQIIIEDGRNFLAHTDNSYDVISLEVGQIFRPGVAAFYTSEFYEQVRERLTPGGIVSQFVTVSAFQPAEFRTIVRTFLEVFPESTLWYNTSELLLIGSPTRPMQVTPAALNRIQSDSVIRDDLKYAYWGGPAHWLNQPSVLLGGFLLDADSLAKLAEDADVYHDELPYLEFITAQSIPTADMPVLDVIREHLSPVERALSHDFDREQLATASVIRELNLRDIVASVYLQATGDLLDQSRRQEMIDQLQAGLAWNPHRQSLLRLMGEALRDQDQLNSALPYFDQAVQIDPTDARNHRNLAKTYLQLGRLQEATLNFEKAIALDPNNADAHNSLGVALAMQNQFPSAIEHLQEALRIEPGWIEAEKNLETALKGQRLQQQGRAAEGKINTTNQPPSPSP